MQMTGFDTKFLEHSPFGRVTLKMCSPAPVFTRQKVYTHPLPAFSFYYFYYEIDSVL